MIRGGYGIFYAAYISEGVGIPQNGFSITPSFTSPNNGLTPAFYWDGGFPQNFNHPPNLTPTVQNGQSAQLVYPRLGGMIPYSQQCNLDRRAPGYRFADGERRIRRKQRHSHLRSQRAA